MKVILFGATGMVGQGVLRECLRDDSVEAVLAVGRNSTGRAHPKLRDFVIKDMFDFGAVGGHLCQRRMARSSGGGGNPTAINKRLVPQPASMSALTRALVFHLRPGRRSF